MLSNYGQSYQLCLGEMDGLREELGVELGQEVCISKWQKGQGVKKTRYNVRISRSSVGELYRIWGNY